jgi:hypothetical protein
MTPADLTVDIVAIIGAVAGKRRNRARNLLQQGADLRAVIDILAGQLGGDDLSSIGVHPIWSFRQHRRAFTACFSTSKWTGSLPGRGRDTGNVSPRRLIVEWSGAARSRSSSQRRDVGLA